jgi:hypothetical protein
MSNWIADEFSINGVSLVRVFLPDDYHVEIPIGDLWTICNRYSGQEAHKDVWEAFLTGSLRVEAVDPLTGKIGLYGVSDVVRHHTPHKKMVRLITEDGRSGDFTEDHSVFSMIDGHIVPTQTGSFKPGDRIVTVGDSNTVNTVGVLSVTEIPSEEHTYDLSVPGPENFVLANGILAHNTYSIGGVSLDIEKSSKYQSMKDSADTMFEKASEAKSRTVKFIRGLQQPRFGMGVRSSFGPAVGKGIMSPRSFMVWIMALIPLATTLMSMGIPGLTT